MYSANFRGFAIRRILVLSLLTLAGLAATFYWQEVKSATTTAALPTLPTLRGEAALDHLKQQGIYASLSEAVTAARYSAQPLPSGRVFEFVNPDNNLRATFNAADRSGARVTASNNKQQRELAIKLAGYGYGQNIIALSPRGVDARQNRVEYTHLPESAIRNPQSAIKEWFVNTRDGIEHGFTLPAPPAVERKGEAALRIEMEIGGDFSVRLSAETQTVSLVDSAGAAELRYDKLRVYDANRRDVPAHFELNTLAPARGTDSNRLAIVVDDRAAAYPLTIDPLLAQGPRLTAGDGAAEDYFGAAVAISGNTAIVGAPRNDINGDADQGAAYIFVRSGGVWTQQDKLRAATGAAGDFFGGSVGIGGDTAIVGAYLNDVGANANQGTAYVFTRSAGVWTQQDKLTAGDGAANDFFGFSIAIDGDTAIVGAHLNDASANGNQGAAYVFTRGSGVWSQLQKLTAPDAAAGDLFGVSIALDAGTAVIGASGKVERGNADAGAAYAFTRSGGLWTMQQKLLPDISAVGNFFGAAVALSGDTALIGSFGDDIGANANQGSAVVFVRSAATWTKQQKLTASDGSPDDRFGLSVALSGDTAVVGATGKDFAGADQGAAYVFSRSGVAWAQRPRLFAIDGEADDKFGAPVAISGDTVLAGASFDDIGANANQGSAQVFVICQGLAEQQRLTANLGSAGDAFGYSVAISGDTAVIGALYNDLGGNADQGTAYVFVRNGATWTQQQKLTDANGVAYDYFGASVAIGGDTVVIGADGNAGLGAAFVFVRNGAVWTQQQKLTDANGAASDSFGRSVAISGDTVVIGAPYDDVGGNLDQGSVIVFVRNGATWTQQRKLTDSLGAAGDDFGRSVAIGGDTAVIGAYGNAGQGAAFVFVRNGAVWTQQQKLTDANGAAGDDFGHSVAISGDTAVIGAPFDNVGGNPDQGSAFVFVRGGATWTQQQKLTNDDGGAFDAFGFSVAISGDLAVVGAIRTPGIASLGSAHVFARSGETWTQQQKLGASNAFYFGYSVGISGDTALIGTISDSAYVFAGAACPAITLNPAALPNGTAGSPYNQSITASGGAGPYNYAVSSGTLPAGLTLDPTTGSLSGLPAAAGTFNFTVTATGGNLCPGSRDYALVIACRTINVTPANPTLPPAEAGAPYNRTVTATGGLAPYSFSIGAGALPAGITLNAATGVLSGTPTVTGVFSFEVRATDGFGCFGSGAYSLTVNCPRITVAPGNSNLPNGALGTVYNQTFSATGGIGAYRFDVVTGALPAGLTLNASSGVLSGTPTARNTFNFIIRATDGAGCTGRSPYRIVVN